MPLSTPPPIQNGLYHVFVCVKERHQKNHDDRGQKRKNEGARMRQRERGGEREYKRERECVCLHIIIPHVHVRATIFATARS